MLCKIVNRRYCSDICVSLRLGVGFHLCQFALSLGHILCPSTELIKAAQLKDKDILPVIICHWRKNRLLVFLAYLLTPCLKGICLCFTFSDFAFLSVYSTWSQCTHWWMMSSTNGWRAWLKTLRRTWDPDCSGTSNSNHGGPPTMWVRKNSSPPLSLILLIHLVWSFK